MRYTPKDIEASSRKITRRGLILGGVQVGFMSVLALRMRHMQVDQADQYRLLAEENRINLRLLPPSRGLIFDRNGRPLATNEQNYRIVVVREDAGDVDEALARIAHFVPMSDDDMERAKREILRRSPFVPVTIADRLTWDEVAEVAVNAPALPGTGVVGGLVDTVGDLLGGILSLSFPVLRPRSANPAPIPCPKISRISSAMSGRSVTMTCPSWRIPIPCCKSRASRSARTGLRRGWRSSCAAVRAPNALR